MKTIKYRHTEIVVSVWLCTISNMVPIYKNPSLCFKHSAIYGVLQNKTRMTDDLWHQTINMQVPFDTVILHGSLANLFSGELQHTCANMLVHWQQYPFEQRWNTLCVRVSKYLPLICVLYVRRYQFNSQIATISHRRTSFLLSANGSQFCCRDNNQSYIWCHMHQWCQWCKGVSPSSFSQSVSYKFGIKNSTLRCFCCYIYC